MADIPKILEEKAKKKNEEILEQILIHLATNNRTLPEDEYKKLMNSLTKGLDKTKTESFSREKFEELRMLTNMGGNRFR